MTFLTRPQLDHLAYGTPYTILAPGVVHATIHLSLSRLYDCYDDDFDRLDAFVALHDLPGAVFYTFDGGDDVSTFLAMAREAILGPIPANSPQLDPHP